MPSSAFEDPYKTKADGSLKTDVDDHVWVCLGCDGGCMYDLLRIPAWLKGGERSNNDGDADRRARALANGNGWSGCGPCSIGTVV